MKLEDYTPHGHAVLYWGMRPSTARRLLAEGDRDGDVLSTVVPHDTEAEAREAYAHDVHRWSARWIELVIDGVPVEERSNKGFDPERDRVENEAYERMCRDERRILYGGF